MSLFISKRHITAPKIIRARMTTLGTMSARKAYKARASRAEPARISADGRTFISEPLYNLRVMIIPTVIDAMAERRCASDAPLNEIGRSRKFRRMFTAAPTAEHSESRAVRSARISPVAVTELINATVEHMVIG